MTISGSVAAIAGIFLVAGWVKGVVGMGLPTVAMGALGLVMAPVDAAALIVVPALVTNVWQFAAGPARWTIARRLASMMAFLCLGTAFGIRILTSSSRWPPVLLGGVLAAYGALGFFHPRLVVPRRAERRLSPLVGVVAGALTGATGVFVVPAVPYFSALDLTRDEMVQALGFSFTVSTLALAAALGSSGHYAPGALLSSTGAVVPALLGMLAGRWTRGRIEPAAFRRWFFTAMVVIGGFMVVRGLAPIPFVPGRQTIYRASSSR